MAGDPLVFLRLSPAQARAVAEALDYLEQRPEVASEIASPEVLKRTLDKVLGAMTAAGVEP